MKKSLLLLLIRTYIGLVMLVFVLFFILPYPLSILRCSVAKNNYMKLNENKFQPFVGFDELSALAIYLLPPNKQYYYNYTSYDSYSVHEIGQPKPSSYWEKFSLDTLKLYPGAKSRSGLAFVESIMVITDQNLSSRHEHLNNVFLRQGIPKSAIEYRWKWNRDNCADFNNSEYIKSIFPYISGDHRTDRGCAVVVEHIDSWYSIAERNLSFALIVEDDVVFVPFLKEKFNRIMSEAVKRNLIKFNKNTSACSDLDNMENITMEQLLDNPILTEGVFHFGKCINIETPGLNFSSLIDIPRFTPYRNYFCGRCAHMYGMTHCAAKMMINTLRRSPGRFQWADWLINHVIINSPKLIGWWPDPPLGYQTSQIEIIGTLNQSLSQRTYDPTFLASAPWHTNCFRYVKFLLKPAAVINTKYFGKFQVAKVAECDGRRVSRL